MNEEVTVTILPEKENEKEILYEIFRELDKKNISYKKIEVKFNIIKKSIDARRKQVKLVLRCRVFDCENEASDEKLPEWKKVGNSSKRVLIIGSGPAGLFGALKLIEYGIKPVIIERGSSTSERKRDIARISTQGLLLENSNYCFGEGGAGTFSDGKLYTRSNKRGDIHSILKIFAHFGADKKILTDAHPHIGTDKLPAVINAMRNFIISMGGDFFFDTKLEAFEFESRADFSIRAAGTRIQAAVTKNTKTGEVKKITADAYLLATGHSAVDVYKLLAETKTPCLEAKTFAMGVRIEHPRSVIDAIQFHGNKNANLGAAEYRITSQQDGRGVYSFCMCPGGFVVPSATSPDQIVVNGMSAAGRNSEWSNAAIVVETRPEDIPEEFVRRAEEAGSKEIAGLLWRTHIERLTAENGDIQKAPAQRLKDFLASKKSDSLPKTSYTPGVVSSELNSWLPEHISSRLKKGFEDFNRKMKGFICDDALLIASETRTSTPVRILRNKDTLESDAIKGLYPCGEGSGYSGGIVSSAMDGENSCTKIAEALR
ncbi:MAG: FAD-dependent monooxygenase [Treponema sp.]|nr:FAD-dependent monooxygenase [Treponema sp.]